MTQQQLTQLGNEIQQCYMHLDLEGEALKRTERGALLAQAELWQEAASDFGRVAEIAETVDQNRHAAQAYVTQGNMLAQGKLWDTANLAYQRGAEMYEALEEYLLAAQALRQVAGYHVWKKDSDEAVAVLEEAIDLLDSDVPEEAMLLIKLYETLTQLYWSLGEFEAANEVIHESREEVGHFAEMSVINDRQQIMHSLISGQISLPEAWAKAMPLITDAGWVDAALGEGILAYNNKDWQKVVTQTALSRQESRDAILTDDEDHQALLRYMLASMLMADAQDKQGNRVSVLVALLTCRSVLTAHMGDVAGRSIDRVLDSMATRWGEEGMAAVVAGYQSYVQEYGQLIA